MIPLDSAPNSTSETPVILVYLVPNGPGDGPSETIMKSLFNDGIFYSVLSKSNRSLESFYSHEAEKHWK